MNNTMFTNADRRGTNNKEENKMTKLNELHRLGLSLNSAFDSAKAEISASEKAIETIEEYVVNHQGGYGTDAQWDSIDAAYQKIEDNITIIQHINNKASFCLAHEDISEWVGLSVYELNPEMEYLLTDRGYFIVDGFVVEEEQEEEKEMEKVSILDRFAAHHGRDVEKEVVVEKKEEVVEEMSSEEMMAEIFKSLEGDGEEMEKKKARKKEIKKIERKLAREDKKSAFKSHTASLFGFVRGKTEVVKDKVVDVVDEKVEDFLFGSLNESPAPVEEEVVEEKGKAEVKGEEVVAEAKSIFNSIMEKKDAFFAEHSLKPVFKSAAPLVEEEEEIDPAVEDIMNKLRAELIERARLEKELEKAVEAKAKVETLEDEIERIKAHLDFLNSQDKAEEAGVPEEEILRTKDDIDAYFMGK